MLVWHTTAQAVHHAIWKLRRKFASADVNPKLIETGPCDQGGGYRLSSPPSNLN